jgi:hypothetical protein
MNLSRFYALSQVEYCRNFIFKRRKSGAVDMRVGSAVSWDSRTLKIVNMADAAISLVGQDRSLVEVPIDGFETLIQEGRITWNGRPGHDSEVVCLQREASEDLA